MSDDKGPVLRSSRAELLGRVRRRGIELRRRRRIRRTISGILPMALLVVLYMANSTEKPALDETGNFLAQSSHSPVTLTTPTLSVTHPPIAAATPSLEPPSAAAPPPECLNSFDPVCGPISWDPRFPKNRALLLEWSNFKTTVRTGELWTASISVRDEVVPSQSVNFGDGSSKVYGPISSASDCRQGYGRWTQLDPKVKRTEPIEFWQVQIEGGEISHTFTTPGQYTVTFNGQSGVMNWRGVCVYDYLETASESIAIEVVQE
jgi:hypothetical protein